MQLLEVSAVSCHRGRTYDAEVQFKHGDWDSLQYKQVVISTGHLDSKAAKAAAETVAASVRDTLVQTALSLLSVYKEAQE
jgi:hypothetical protein